MNPSILLRNFAPMAGHCYCRTIGTTHAVYTIPPELKGRSVVFTAYGANVWILFGTSASVEVSAKKESAYSAPPALVVDATTGIRIPEEGSIEVFIPFKISVAGVPTAVTHFAMEADDTDGYWECTPVGEMS
jgi:hypothetical protein